MHLLQEYKEVMLCSLHCILSGGMIILICPITDDDVHLTKVVSARLFYFSYSFPFVINTGVDLLSIHFGPKAISCGRAK